MYLSGGDGDNVYISNDIMLTMRWYSMKYETLETHFGITSFCKSIILINRFWIGAVY